MTVLQGLLPLVSGVVLGVLSGVILGGLAALAIGLTGGGPRSRRP